MADLDSRNQQFQGGAFGGGPGVSAATALPQTQQADPTFQGGSSLLIPNTIKPINGVSDSSYINSMIPYAAKTSPMARAQAGEQQQAQELKPAMSATQESV